MSRFSSHGDECPFCDSPVPQTARVCAACGGRKATRSDTVTGMWALVRFSIWGNTVGLVMLVTAILTWDYWKHDHYVYAALIVILGIFLTKVASWIWKKIFGSLADKIWLR